MIDSDRFDSQSTAQETTSYFTGHVVVAGNDIRLACDRLEVITLRTGAPELEMKGDLRETLLAIKRGEVALAEVLARAEGMTADLEAAYRATPLPDRPDVVRAHALLVRIGEELARRWVRQEPGPWGVSAPPAPDPSEP